MNILNITQLGLLEEAVEHYESKFEYAASKSGTPEDYKELVEINSKLTTARLALYDYRHQQAFMKGEII